MDSRVLKLVTRQSPLALWQANWVKERLESYFSGLTVTLVKVITDGDRWLETPLYKIGGKALFVKALQEKLLSGEADLAVHSMKDVPSILPDGLCLTAISKRASAQDALISKVPLSALPAGACIGTSSLRRACQLKHYYPSLDVKPLRGNVGTRLRKYESGEYDAIILAEAGLARLGFSDYAALPVDTFLPAPGQGALGIECREDDKTLRALLAEALHHAPTATCVTAERTLNALLGGSCQAPIAALATIQGEELRLEGRVGTPEGGRLLIASAVGHRAQAKVLPKSVYTLLQEQGAEALLAQMKGNETDADGT